MKLKFEKEKKINYMEDNFLLFFFQTFSFNKKPPSKKKDFFYFKKITPSTIFSKMIGWHFWPPPNWGDPQLLACAKQHNELFCW